MRVRHHRPRLLAPGAPRERGAAIVELAIVAIFLVTLLAGAYDLGMGWRSTLAVTEGVRGGARVGSGLGADRTADVTILTSLQSTLASSGLLGSVERVVIFSAEGTGGRPSAGCIAGTSGTCSTFTGEQFRAVTTGSPLDPDHCVLAATRRGFCPRTRDDVQLTADYVGVWVRARHTYLFPVLGRGVTIERSAVMRIEP
ncbi:pilus assembly protein [Iamia sp. SCSIO 61187]|uniref:TadE/TadG family type IV pilus assembly protein n=1 Tax=Iamia sp. SCSIO 61187 TaxID=2722752 RepID=UPI001C6333D8|nr:TadE family protein [Iamia sp. SCSIO 61187]QYG92541.1 pilus assembly protein [Iamia sp. SCSIO 61187]